MRNHDGKEFGDSDMDIIYWLGWSLGHEEKRALLEILFNQTYEVTTQSVADVIGLNTNVVKGVLQNLASTKLITRSGGGNGHTWKIENADVYKILQRILIKKDIKLVERSAVAGEIVDDIDEDF